MRIATALEKIAVLLDPIRRRQNSDALSSARLMHQTSGVERRLNAMDPEINRLYEDIKAYCNKIGIKPFRLKNHVLRYARLVARCPDVTRYSHEWKRLTTTPVEQWVRLPNPNFYDIGPVRYAEWQRLHYEKFIRTKRPIFPSPLPDVPTNDLSNTEGESI
jgi:hypothetical protein